MPRLGHRKSRRGCLKCKERKVKCDENNPCGACLRHKLACVFPSHSRTSSPQQREPPLADELTRNAGRSVMASGSSHPRDPTDESPCDLSPPSGVSLISNPDSLGSTPDPFPYFAKFSHGGHPNATSAGSWISDLELLHHYSTTAYRTLPRSDEAETIWQVELPRLAFKHLFLMHQILAISGCHLAFQHPQDRSKYSLQALSHQSTALQGFRAALAEITVENCHAIFAASSLLLMSAFASLPIHEQSVSNNENKQPNVDDILDIFLLIRGTQEILTSFEPTLQCGPFKDLFLPSPNPTTTPLLEMVLDYLDQLTLQLFHSEIEPVVRASANCESARLATCIRDAIATATNPEYRVTVTWPKYLAEDFLNFIRGRHPVALTVVAPYCLVVHATESKFWFTRGWGSRMADAIASCVEAPWEEICRWPLERITHNKAEAK